MHVPSSIASLHTLGFIRLPHNGMEWLIIGFIGLLVFGKRLPGMARGIGQSIVEFKRGMKSGEQDAEVAATEEPKAITAAATATAKPRFDPQTGKPLSEAVGTSAG
jgi:sec-independent protein translocase protein TatA